MRRMSLTLSLAAVLTAACHQPAPGNTAASGSATGNALTQLNALPPAQRQLVLFRAIRDAGQDCQDINRVERLADQDGRATWRVTCRGGGQFAGAPLLILHTRGAKSGEPRINPMVYQDVNGSYAVFASFAGAAKNPAWFHNLVAHPEVTLEIGTETYAASAAPVPEPERAALFRRVVAERPGFGDYQAKTDRVIPVVELTRS